MQQYEYASNSKSSSADEIPERDVTYLLIFIHMTSNTFILLYKPLVRPHLKYAKSVYGRHPHQVGDIEDIEKVQIRATMLVIKFNKLSYKERLEHLDLVTLKYRRFRGDMIEVYKIVTNKYECTVSPVLQFNTNTVIRDSSPLPTTPEKRHPTTL